jgi:hypothetical protein
MRCSMGRRMRVNGGTGAGAEVGKRRHKMIQNKVLHKNNKFIHNINKKGGRGNNK